MAEITPAHHRMNILNSEIRALLKNMHPDRAEAIREEIVVVMAAMKVEILKWQGDRSTRRVMYHRGAVLEAAGGDYEAMCAVARVYSSDYSKLLT